MRARSSGSRGTPGDEPVDARSLRTSRGSYSIAPMLAALWLLARTPPTEGKNVILSMLVVGLIFLAVIALGELSTTPSAPARSSPAA